MKFKPGDNVIVTAGNNKTKFKDTILEILDCGRCTFVNFNGVRFLKDLKSTKEKII